jgi:hypothetical protein
VILTFFNKNIFKKTCILVKTNISLYQHLSIRCARNLKKTAGQRRKKMTTTAKEARETKIFVIEQYNEKFTRNYVGINSDGNRVFVHTQSETKNLTKVKELSSTLVECSSRVVETNLYDFIMASVDETTSPRGVEPRLHTRQEGRCLRNENDFNYDENEPIEVWTWGIRGNNPSLIDTVASFEEAEDFIFQRTYEYDFLPDDQRDTRFFYTEEEAEAEIISDYASANDIDIEVAESILKHKKMAEEIETKREYDRKQAAIKANEAFIKYSEEISAIHVESLPNIEGETYKDTCSRLSAALGKKIDGKVFHAAVSKIRNK